MTFSDAELDDLMETAARDLYHRSGLALETFSWHDITEADRQHFRDRIANETIQARVIAALRESRERVSTLQAERDELGRAVIELNGVVRLAGDEIAPTAVAMLDAVFDRVAAKYRAALAEAGSPQPQPDAK